MKWLKSISSKTKQTSRAIDAWPPPIIYNTRVILISLSKQILSSWRTDDRRVLYRIQHNIIMTIIIYTVSVFLFAVDEARRSALCGFPKKKKKTHRNLPSTVLYYVIYYIPTLQTCRGLIVVTDKKSSRRIMYRRCSREEAICVYNNIYIHLRTSHVDR